MNRRQFINSLLHFGMGTYISFLPNDFIHEKKEPPIKLIIDADTANEVDDLFAIVRALVEPSFDLAGITAAQWHSSPIAPRDTVGESHRINQKILQLMHRMDVPLRMGSNVPMVSKVRPQPSEAAHFIIETAMGLSREEKLSIVILGPATNVASAVLLQPAIASKIKVYYLGFWHHPASNTWNKTEFNTGNDPNAVNTLIDNPEIEFHVMTASTSQHLVFQKSVVEQQLKDKHPLGNYLIERWENYERWWQDTDKEKTKWTMWDVAIIEALAHPELAIQQKVMAPHDNLQREIWAYTHLEADAMESKFWQALAKI